jgi:hypothetical protein
MEIIKGESNAREKIAPFIKLACDGDEELEEIFILAYKDWKEDRQDFEKKRKDADPNKINN